MEKIKHGSKLVAIGGGTGLSTLLRGIKHYLPQTKSLRKREKSILEQVTAIVTVTDDGGSSGKLRDELHVLPPGDIRNCMVALAEDEALMTQFFNYRFSGNGDLQGHSFGNLYLAAVTEVLGNFLAAIRFVSKVLSIKGEIYPSTMDDVTLAAELANGESVCGETNISHSTSRIKRMWLEPASVKALPEALNAIAEADIITIGPGSLFTSILPNLLVPGFIEAIAAAKAQKIFICNVMTQPGETDGFNVMDHINVIDQYAPQIEFDAVLVNSTALTPLQLKEYLEKGCTAVINNLSERFSMNLKSNNDKRTMFYHCDLINENFPTRHDSTKLAAKIIDIICPQFIVNAS